MKIQLKTDRLNAVEAGDMIYASGDPVETIALVVKGKVHMYAPGVNAILGKENFLGIMDLTQGVQHISYAAQTDVTLYVFTVTGSMQDVRRLMQVNVEYGALLISNLSKNIKDFSMSCEEMDIAVQDAYFFLSRTYQHGMSLARNAGIDFPEIEALHNLNSFQENDYYDAEKVRYYRACCQIPFSIQKSFYGEVPDVTVYHVRDQIRLLNQIVESSRNKAQYICQLIGPMVQEQKNLYLMLAGLITALRQINADSSEVLHMMDDTIDEINRMEKILMDNASMSAHIDRDFMEETYYMLLNHSAVEENKTSAVMAEDDMLALVEEQSEPVVQLHDVLDHILEFSGLSAKRCDKFRNLIIQFSHLPDAFSNDDDTRRLRREIAKEYYGIYQSVFLKDYKSQEDTPLEIDLFLRYGLLSEKLISNDIMGELYDVYQSVGEKKKHTELSECCIYDMKEWLSAIMRGEKEPSKNEFDMDYTEFLRDRIKGGYITAEQQKQLEHDVEQKLDFEINNLFRVNHRLVSGQIATFVPFLYTEGCSVSPEKSFLSAMKLSAVIHRLRQIDYSIFYREMMPTQKIPGMEKEMIQKEVSPDIIIFPCYGSRGIMWQEMAGRRHSSRGRLLLPSFLDGNIEKVMAYLLGSFRWELCRSLQGVHWNDIQNPSLTSEYSDFLQFYKKNKDLSDEKKEKLKQIIQKCRNNNREVFVTDYLNWIFHEAKGSMVLSKPVREIMATYCPFSAKIREKLDEQPLFRQAMNRDRQFRAKKTKEYDLKFRVWNRQGIIAPKEIQQTKRFYTEL